MATTYATPPSPAADPLALRPSDLAGHFMECGALNTNLSLAPGERLVITDDLLNGTVGDVAALSMAAIVARDSQVALAALLPLSATASKVSARNRPRYEQLFQLIEESAFDAGVRDQAESLVAAGFREARIRELAAELGGNVGPARTRYRAFLDIVKLLAAQKISEPAFLDEFMEFTRAVAGKLDFGIYAVCVDRLFISPYITLAVKAALAAEVLKYPPLVRKELITNLLASSAAPDELVRYAQGELAARMTREQITEIVLFTTLKRAWAAQKQIRRPS